MKGPIVVCLALLGLGLALTVRWAGHAVEPPPPTADAASPTTRELAARYARGVALAVLTGIVTGMLVLGPGARLAMRLLAVTAGDQAQGRLTEAEEVVGAVTTGGTIGIFLFVGLGAGMITAAGYVLLHRWLPSGLLAGLTYGALVLVLGGSRLDPLRADNPDFDLVGPAWLSILTFTALALAQGMAIAAVAGRLSRSVPLPGRDLRTLAWYVPLVLLVPVLPLALGVLLVGIVYVGARSLTAGRTWSPASVDTTGRVVLVGLALVAMPGFVSALADIAGRGP